MNRQVAHGAQDQSVVIRIVDEAGVPVEDAVHNSAGIAVWFRREGGTKTAITLKALATPALDDAHDDGGFLHIDDGYYRLDSPDAAFASGAAGVMFGGAITDGVIIGAYVPLVAYNPQDGVRLGLTAIPNAAAGAADGLVVGSAANKLAVDAAGKVTVPDTQKVDAHTARGRAIGDVGEGNTAHLLQAADAGATAVARPGDEMELTDAQEIALVAAIEAEIADDATGEAVKQAIIDKLIENLPDLDDLSLAAISQAVWDRLTSALTTSGSIGKLIADLLDAAISSRHEAGAAVASVTGDVGGKVLGGGSGTITGVGARSDLRAIHDIPVVVVAEPGLTEITFRGQVGDAQNSSLSFLVNMLEQTGTDMWMQPIHRWSEHALSATPQAAATILDELTEDDGEGNLRLTSKALEQVSVELGDIEVPIDEEAIADAVAPVVWAHAQRTLTSAAQLPEEETSAELITRRRGDSWSVSLTGLGNITDAEEIWLTLKRQPNQLDSAAVLQVTSTGGLVIGLTAEPTDAAIAVDDAVAGDLTITVEPAATKLVAPRTYEYDIQVRRTGGQIQTLAVGQWSVPPDVTRSV
jgi:hypothetical protein